MERKTTPYPSSPHGLLKLRPVGLHAYLAKYAPMPQSEQDLKAPIDQFAYAKANDVALAMFAYTAAIRSQNAWPGQMVDYFLNRGRGGWDASKMSAWFASFEASQCVASKIGAAVSDGVNRSVPTDYQGLEKLVKSEVMRVVPVVATQVLDMCAKQFTGVKLNERLVDGVSGKGLGWTTQFQSGPLQVTCDGPCEYKKGNVVAFASSTFEGKKYEYKVAMQSSNDSSMKRSTQRAIGSGSKSDSESTVGIGN